MASAEAEAIKATYRQMRASGSAVAQVTSIEQMQASVASAPIAPPPDDVAITEVDAGGCSALWHDAEGGLQDRVFVYMHGGGYVVGSAARSAAFASYLAKILGCRVLNLDYRLAPQHPHPAPVHDAGKAYRWLLGSGYTPGHIAVSGDSAGGGLALATLLHVRELGLPAPGAAVLMSPWTDVELTGDSMISRAESDLLVTRELLVIIAKAFLGGSGNPRDPLASPLHGDFRGLPPIYIQVGDDEVLLDDANRAADKARAAGVDVRLDVFPEMQHVFQTAGPAVPEAVDAVQRMADWLKPRLGLAVGQVTTVGSARAATT
jgi:acetyl esterase/lipase